MVVGSVQAQVPFLLVVAYFNTPFATFADGGIPPVGKPSIVGEEGPEIFIPQERGLVLPNDIFEATKEALETDGEVVPAEEAEQTEAALAANNSNISNTYNTTNETALEAAKALERNNESISNTYSNTTNSTAAEEAKALQRNSESINSAVNTINNKIEQEANEANKQNIETINNTYNDEVQSALAQNDKAIKNVSLRQ